MIPVNKVRDLISKHESLEKELSSGTVDKKKFAEKSKEYSDLNDIIKEAKEYLSFSKEKEELEKICLDKNSEKEIKDLADFELSDRIKTWYTGDGNLKEAVVAYAEYIQDETLSIELEESIPPENPLVFTSDIEIDGMIGKIAVQRE